VGGRWARKQGDDYYTGRWLTHDRLGMVSNSQSLNYFKPDNQYSHGLSLYEYVSSNPVIGIDPSGLKKEDPSYQLYGPVPQERASDDGTWNTGPAWRKALLGCYLQHNWNYAYILSGTWDLLGWRDAAYYMRNYLNERGWGIVADYPRMLRDSKDARKVFMKDLKIALTEAEKLVDSSDPQPKQITSVMMLGNEGVEDDMNWRLAIHSYYSWGRGYVTKGKGRKSCCYRMSWTHHISDVFDFKRNEAFALWQLNYYGWAKYFRVKGKHEISVTWIKGYRFDREDPLAVVEGRLLVFSQCQ